MHYPIVKVTTKDHLSLFGLLAETNQRKQILIHIHGTASGFYAEEFEQQFFEQLPAMGCSVLFTNNRGGFVMESWQKSGAALEKFEDCVLDIDAWIEYALSLGYEEIILQGHSLGTEKVVYYMEKGKYANRVSAVSLLGFSDSFGSQQRFLKTITVDPMIEAQQLVANGKGEQFIQNPWNSHAGVLPQSAESYINFFSDGSELSKALPLRQGKDLVYFQRIQVPILGVIGDQDPWTVIPVSETVELLRKENALAEVVTIPDCNHSFEGKQKELVDAVRTFILKKS